MIPVQVCITGRFFIELSLKEQSLASLLYLPILHRYMATESPFRGVTYGTPHKFILPYTLQLCDVSKNKESPFGGVRYTKEPPFAISVPLVKLKDILDRKRPL